MPAMIQSTFTLSGTAKLHLRFRPKNKSSDLKLTQVYTSDCISVLSHVADMRKAREIVARIEGGDGQ